MAWGGVCHKGTSPPPCHPPNSCDGSCAIFLLWFLVCIYSPPCYLNGGTNCHMDRRHQVFVSSTYGDLAEERAEIIQALLELDCIPAGMELFPATTEDAWELIKSVIDDSDYYCLVLGGRYGSVDSAGVSYTEKEYDYAMSQKKPVMAFVHANPESIPVSKTERSDTGRKRLQKFQEKVEVAHHRKTWSTPAELGGLVSRSLVNLRKAHPSEGWVRGRYAATDAMIVEVANLRAQLAEMTASAVKGVDSPAQDIEALASGTDPYKVSLTLQEVGKKETIKKTVTTTWDNILKYVGPALLNECTDEEFYAKLRLCFYHAAEAEFRIKVEYEGIVLPIVVRDQIKIQLRALGQMVPGMKRRAVADRKTYWKLTELGEKRLITAQAIAKPVKAPGPIDTVLKAVLPSGTLQAASSSSEN